MLEEAIIQKASDLGFLACGFAKAKRLDEYEESFNRWIENGYQGEMGYLERNVEKRLNPQELVKGTKSLICLAYNYFPKEDKNPGKSKIAKYAWGEDYHKVVKDKCYQLLEFIKEVNPQISYRVFVDSAPVMERQWAQKAGIGWIGKNSLLLRKGVGSNFFLAEIFLDIELKTSQPYPTQHCGDCRACIDACPTQAIVDEGVIDARKCISYLTIEKKSELSTQETNQLNDWVFGCDICQDVCPWNSFSTPTDEPRFKPFFSIGNINNFESMSEDEFNEVFGKTPLTRMGYEKFKRLVLLQNRKG